jgi:hypothetical protein
MDSNKNHSQDPTTTQHTDETQLGAERRPFEAPELRHHKKLPEITGYEFS